MLQCLSVRWPADFGPVRRWRIYDYFLASKESADKLRVRMNAAEVYLSKT